MATDRAAVPSSSDYAPQLDGLRAVAVAAVAWSHWLPQWQAGLPFGAGVHLFFVLSGFLITRILLGLRGQPRPGAAIGRFYLRRALRLFPAFYLVLGLAAWADVPLVRATWAWHATYLSNLYIAAGERWLGHVSHFWSLAVEEQFYLLWPWLIVFAPAARLGMIIGALILAGPAARTIASLDGLPEPFWALVPAGSADSLGVGAWLAWSRWRSGNASPASASDERWTRIALAAAAAWAVLGCAEGLGWTGPALVVVWRQVLQAAMFGWIVHRAADGRLGGPAGLLTHPVVRYVGRISYGVYLIHAFAPVLLSAALRAVDRGDLMPANAPLRAVAFAVTTLVAAAVMWHVVEAPLNALKSRLPLRS